MVREQIINLSHVSVPSPPTNTRIETTEETLLTVAWNAPLAPNGIIIAYTVEYWMEDDDGTKLNVVTNGEQPRHATLNRLQPFTAYVVQVSIRVRMFQPNFNYIKFFFSR